MNKASCRDCKKRHIGCHADCKEYKEYKKKLEREKENRKADIEYYSHKNDVFKRSGGQR